MFCKIFKSKKYTQIVVIRGQDESGAPEVRFFFQPDGMGIWQFALAAKNKDSESQRMNKVFESIKGSDAHQIVTDMVASMEPLENGEDN